MSNRLPTKGTPDFIYTWWCEAAGEAYWLDSARPRLWRLRRWFEMRKMDILNPFWHWGW